MKYTLDFWTSLIEINTGSTAVMIGGWFHYTCSSVFFCAYMKIPMHSDDHYACRLWQSDGQFLKNKKRLFGCRALK